MPAMNGVAEGLGNPTVSVVIPTFRRSEYLSEALSSALGQTYRDLEVIVTDNDSHGPVPEAVARCADPRLRYRRNASDLGPMRNFLSAVADARGRYVAPLHDDDLWEPTLLERLLPYLERDATVVLAFAESHIIDAEGRIDVACTEASIRRWGRDRLAPGRHAHFATGLLHGTIPGVVGTVVRRSAIDWRDFPEEVTSAYDLWLVYRAVCSGGATVYHPERLVRYRHHGGNATRENRCAHGASAVYCYDRFLADRSLRRLRAGFQIRGADQRVGLATALMRADRVRDARPLLRKAVRQHPTPRALGALLVSLLPSPVAAFVSTATVAIKRRLVPGA